MKSVKIIVTVLLGFVVCSGFMLKKEKKQVYAFGISTSFTDTVVYYTEIQAIDSVVLVKGMLPYRDLYSYQLKDYLEYKNGLTNRTCMIYYSDDSKKINKEQTKVLSKIKKDKSLVLKEIKSTDFTFKKPMQLE